VTDNEVVTVSGLRYPVHPGAGTSDCPICGKTGRRVIPVTMSVHLSPAHWALLGDGYRFCFTPSCPMMYYRNDEKVYFVRDEVKTRFGPKETAPPRPLCYCLQVTEEQIAEEILEKRCCTSLQEIERFTRAGTGKWCLTTNPSGKCCREYLPEIVAKYLPRVKELEFKAEVDTVLEKVEEKTRFRLVIGGMSCESCARGIASTLKHYGATKVQIDFPSGKGEAIFPGTKSMAEIREWIEELGYEVKEVEMVKEG
jgi:copper chaperone CopZ/bacterioferritin-associated ferredoxin